MVRPRNYYPKKIIDFCLKFKITKEACDLLDLVYVLTKCLEVTNYRMLEVNNYLNLVEAKIMENFKPEEGGFSYKKIIVDYVLWCKNLKWFD